MCSATKIWSQSAAPRARTFCSETTMILIQAHACWCSYANYLANHEPSIVPRKVLNFPSIGINIVLKGDIKSLNAICYTAC